MKAYVGVTDNDWYRFLAARPHLTEVNFWRPAGDRGFHVLQVGEPFFFKTHAPHNRVVGGGFYSGFVPLRLSEAWALYGEANGVDGLTQMRRQIGQYRREPMGPGDDPEIGCLLLRDVTFFDDDLIAGPPPEFAPNVVQGRGYDLSESKYEPYFRDLLLRMVGAPAIEVDFSQPWHRSGPTYGDPRLAPQRLGQQAFQAVVLDAYHRRCAITGAKIRPVLQAAHIVPLPRGGEHRLDNGVLLRSDVHTLYDQGYVGIDRQHRLLVSPRLRSEFGNGEQFYAMVGQPIAVPERKADRPNADFLQWHLDTIYQAA